MLQVGGGVGAVPLPSPSSEAKVLGKGETHLRDPAEARLLPDRDMAMRLRVRVRGGMGGVPGAEERGRVGGAVGRAGPGHVILSLGPLPGMASPLTLQQDTQALATAGPATRLKVVGRASGQPEITSPTLCPPDEWPCPTGNEGLAQGHTGIGAGPPTAGAALPPLR